MKRPVFWAVVMFALGEVAGLQVRTWKQFSIAFAMLFCVVEICFFILGKTHPKLRRKRIVIFVVLLGLLYSPIKSGNYKYWNIKDKIDSSNAILVGQVKNVSATASGTAVTLEVRYAQIQRKDENSKGNVSLEIGKRVLVTRYDDTEGQAGGGPVLDVQIGDIVIVKGKIQLFKGPENPGQFDQRQYYLARQIRYKCVVSDEFIVVYRGHSIRQNIMDVRACMKKLLFDNVDEKTAAYYSGVLLGDKSAIDKNIRLLFECAGISHILSISALHISFVAMTFYKLLRRLGMRFVFACPAAGILVVLYGTLTAWSFSAVRAAIMLILVFVGELCGRKVDLLTSASIALLCMIVTSPYLLFDGGVCIGFAAIVGIASGQYINRELTAFKSSRKKKRDKLWLREVKKIIQKHIKGSLKEHIVSALVMSVTISVFTAPVVARLYYSVSLYSPLINLIIVPLMSVVVACGLIGLLLVCAHARMVGGLFLRFGGKIFLFFEWLSRWVIHLPFATIKTGKITLLEVLIYYLFASVGLFLLSKRFRLWAQKIIHRFTYKWVDKKLWRKVLAVILAIHFLMSGAILCGLHKIELREQITILSVGQGDGILIRTDSGCNIVIDGGSTSNEAMGETILMPAIKALSMHKIDYWIVSHADIDHISGLLAVLEAGELSQISIDHLVVADVSSRDDTTQELVRRAKEKGIRICYMKEGDVIQGEKFKITCIAPVNITQMELQDRNSQSLCIVYESNDLFAVFTGDADEDEMERVKVVMKNIKKQDDAKQYILKIPHHGSRYSYVEGVYQYFDVAIISCGKNNMYGHPHKEIIKALEEENIETFRTDRDGAILIRNRILCYNK